MAVATIAIVSLAIICDISSNNDAQTNNNRGETREVDMKTLKIGVAGMIAASALSIAPASAQTADGPAVEWRHSVWGKSRANTKGMEKIAEIVKEKTGGKFTIKIGYGEVFSKDKENLDSIKLGAIEMADMCNFYHPGKNPSWMVFSLPFLPLEDLEVGAAAGDATAKHPILMADMALWDAQPYFFTILPQYELMGKGKPPLKLDDWKGLGFGRRARSEMPSRSWGPTSPRCRRWNCIQPSNAARSMRARSRSPMVMPPTSCTPSPTGTRPTCHPASPAVRRS